MLTYVNGLLAVSDADIAELENAVNSLSPEEQEALVFGAVGVVTVAVVVGLVWYILQVVAQWCLFSKAGEPGWKCLIPFYNYYTQYKLTWNGSVFWTEMAMIFAASFLSNMSQNGGSAILGILGSVCAFVVFVIGVISAYKLSVSYGHGVGFAIGLLLLHPIFILILGFGRSAYIGPNGERGTVL